eukprot:XP_011426712.1 PREDICTED: cholecystokinin receptor type A [Crassostrea gigas]
MGIQNITNKTENDVDIYTLNSLRAEFLTVNTVILGVYLVIGVLGNSLVFYIYKCCITKHRTDRFFIPYLAVSDALSCIVGSGFGLALNLLPIRFSGDALCKGLWFLTKWSTLVSALMLLLIAIERYKKVCKPFGPQMTPLAKQLSIIALFVLSAILTFPTVFFHGEISFPARGTSHLTGYRCGRNTFLTGLEGYFTIYNVVLAAVAFTGITAVTILYVFVGKTIYKQTKFRSRFASSPRKSYISPKSDSGVVSDGNDDVFLENSVKENEENKARKDSADSFYSTDDELESTDADLPRKKNSNNPRKKSIISHVYTVPQVLRKFKISILFMCITLVFILTFTPRLVIMISEATNKGYWSGLTDNQIRASLFFYRFYIVNNIVNPFLYAAFDSRFKQEIKKRLSCFKKT